MALIAATQTNTAPNRDKLLARINHTRENIGNSSSVSRRLLTSLGIAFRTTAGLECCQYISDSEIQTSCREDYCLMWCPSSSLFTKKVIKSDTKRFPGYRTNTINGSTNLRKCWDFLWVSFIFIVIFLYLILG